MDGTGERRILITGADGTIGRVLREGLAGRYSLRLLDREMPEFAGADNRVADISNLDGLLSSFEGIETCVHLAGAASPDSSWPEVLPSNIVGTYNVFEAARRSGVRRVIYASSTHAVRMHEAEAAPDVYRASDSRTFDEYVELRPDTVYGLSKAFGELVGRLYAETHDLSVICLRIGYMPDTPDEEFGSKRPPEMDEGFVPRARAIWLSHRDCVALFRCAIDAPAQLRWLVAYGTSANERQIWDLTSAREQLGYRPLDRAP